MKEAFIRQTRDATCLLISALNARVFYNLSIKNTREDSLEFKKLAALGCCKNGPCICIEEVYKTLGLRAVTRKKPTAVWIRNQLKKGRCVQIVMSTPIWNLHAALIVGIRGKLFEVVNSQLYGEHHIELLTWRELCFSPALTYRKHYTMGCCVFHPSGACAKISI